MRLLFYTATFSLLLAGGLFAYFAVQTPQVDTGPKVVLSIEPYQATLAEANTREIIQQQASASANLETTDSASDRLPQEEAINPASDRLPQEEAAAELSDAPPANSGISEEPQDSTSSEQEIAEAIPQNPEAEPEPVGAVISFPGLAVAEPVDSPNEQPVPTSVPFQQFPSAADSDTAETNKSGKIAGTENNLPNGIVTNEAETQPQQVDEANIQEAETSELEVAALPDTQSEQLPIANGAEAIEIEPQPQSTAPLAPETTEQPANEAVEAEPSKSVNADQPPLKEENAQELRATFNAFVASLKEKERQEALLVRPQPPLPLKRPDNIPAPIRTASLSSTGASSPRVAILLRGLGRNDKNSEIAVTTLPPAISLGVAPYVGGPQQWAAQARERGHEIIIQVPLEPADYPNTNPGPETLLTSSNSTVNASKLRTVLNRFDGYSGVTNYFGGKLLQSQDSLRPILEDIKSRGLIYIGEPDSSQTLVRKLAAEIGVLYGGADIVIDTFQTRESIQKSLDELVALARKQGSAIGLAYASRTSIDQLRIWSEKVSSKGVTLVPVGVLAQNLGAS